MSERALWALTAAGGIPHVRIGKMILYPTDALRRWLDGQAAKGMEGGNHDAR